MMIRPSFLFSRLPNVYKYQTLRSYSKKGPILKPPTVLHPRKMNTTDVVFDVDESEEDIGPEEEEQDILGNQFTGMRIAFLGTASKKSANNRNVTSIAVQIERETWLFDCGDGTQHQLQKCPGIPKAISRVFITHLHGDHIFGLPAIACSSENKTIHIHGPVGLRSYLFNSLASSLIAPHKILKYVSVKELVPRNFRDRDYCIKPDQSNIYNVYENDSVIVRAMSIRHSVPTFGYVIEEKSRPGTILVDKLTNLGLKPSPLYRQLKDGQDVQLPNGTWIRSKDVVLPRIPGRKIVILGDTYDAFSLRSLAANADIVVHEATLADEFKELAISRAHSCPSIAGEFARSVNANQLIITHFGGKYASKDSFVESVMVKQARIAFGSDKVIAAKDFLVIDVPRKTH